MGKRIAMTIVLAGGLGLIAAGVGNWEGRVWPGVAVGEISLGNWPRTEAEAVINWKFKGVKEMELVYGTQTWAVTTDDLGVVWDAGKTADRAMAVGRSGNIGRDISQRWVALTRGVKVEPVYTLDEDWLEETVRRIAKELDIPAQEPAVTIETDGQVRVTHGENGQEVDRQKLMTKLRQAIRRAEAARLEIPVVQLSPRLSDEQLVRTRERAEAMVKKRLVITFEEERQNWDVGEELVVTWLDPQGEGWKRGRVEAWVGDLAGTIDRLPQNALFQFMGGGRVEEFRPAKLGYRVRQGELTDLLVEELGKLEKSGDNEADISLPVEKVAPEVTTADANDLGIKELLGRGESWYAGSITNRIFNLKKAADTLNGVLVAPGETFSFNQTVGEVSAATGYKQAYIIKRGQTILGDGGGVCQTSSTLFRAVLAAGLPIGARTAHAYRVSYYEQNYQVGFDATVFQPAPDFKFTNDTPGYVLIQTEFDEKKKYLAFAFYGTSDGRKVELSKSRMWDVVPPPPDLYIDDPNLAAGVVQQTEHKAAGAKVAFDWKVTRGDEILQERTFYSVYRPWQAVFLRGTKIN